MEPGELNYRAMLQIKRETRDQLGGVVTTWVDKFMTWAQVTPLSGRELIAAQQKHAEITTRFRIRFRRGIDTQWRIVWEGRAYDILDVTDVEARHWELEIMCSSGLRSG